MQAHRVTTAVTATLQSCNHLQLLPQNFTMSASHNHRLHSRHRRYQHERGGQRARQLAVRVAREYVNAGSSTMQTPIVPHHRALLAFTCCISLMLFCRKSHKKFKRRLPSRRAPAAAPATLRSRQMSRLQVRPALASCVFSFARLNIAFLQFVHESRFYSSCFSAPSTRRPVGQTQRPTAVLLFPILRAFPKRLCVHSSAFTGRRGGRQHRQ